jgi:cytochrome bd-I ubiquinol oxidase subunit X
MWYFSWILGISLACAFAILNAMWYELRDDQKKLKATAKH